MATTPRATTTTVATTIQISGLLLETLKKHKLYDRESYEEVIWDALEDSREINHQTKSELEKARKDITRGKFYTHEQVKKRLRL